MPLGTAPRRHGAGIWYTASGRPLTPAQATIWEGYYRSGRTDGHGHFTRPSVVQGGPTMQQARRPSGIGATAAARVRITPPKPTTQQFALASEASRGGVMRSRPDVQEAIRQTRAYYARGHRPTIGGVARGIAQGYVTLETMPTRAVEAVTQRKDIAAAEEQLRTSRVWRSRQAEQVRQQALAGRISGVEAQRRLRQLQPSQASVVPSVGLGLVGKTLEDFATMGIEAPAMVKYGAEHPLGFAKGMYEGTKQVVEHPLAHPGYTLATLGGAKALVGGGIGRGEAALNIARGRRPRNIMEAAQNVPKVDTRAVGVMQDPGFWIPHHGGLERDTYERLQNPSRELREYMNHNPEAEYVRNEVLNQVGQGKLRVVETGRRRRVTQPIMQGLATRPVRTATALIRTPKPKRRQITYQGPEGEMSASWLGSRDYLTNWVQRNVYDRIIQAQLDRKGLIPGGKAVAEQHKLNMELQGPAVTEGLHAINQVHGARPLDRRLSVLADPRMHEGSWGFHLSWPSRRTGLDEPYLIQMNPNPGHEQVKATTIHEAGHAMVGSPGALVSEGDRAHVLAAMARSEGIKNIHASLKDTGVEGYLKRYLTKPVEMMARGYTQYIALRSGSHDVLEHLAESDRRTGDPNFHRAFPNGMPNRHWSDEDFAPIAAEFDKMFEKLGWRKKGRPVVEEGSLLAKAPLVGKPLSRVYSPTARVGRAAQAERKVQEALDTAQLGSLEQFGKTTPARIANILSGRRYDKPAIIASRRRQGLTAAENMALDIAASLGGELETSQGRASLIRHAQTRRIYEERQLQQAQGGRERTVVDEPNELLPMKASIWDKLLRKEWGHRYRIAMIKAATRELRNPRPQLVEALRQSRETSQARERLLGMGPEDREGFRVALHRIGARAQELRSAELGAESPLKVLERAEQAYKNTRLQIDRIKAATYHLEEGEEEVAARLGQEQAELEIRAEELRNEIDNIHEQFVQTGLHLRKQGAFYVPSKSTRDLRNVSAGAGRDVSEYGVAPPRTLPELRHRYMAELERGGNARFDVPGLVGTAYRRAERYAAVERGYRELLKVSHGTREAAGPDAIPIREVYNVPFELKDMILKADMGYLTKADLKAFQGIERSGRMQEWMNYLFPDRSTVTGNSAPALLSHEDMEALGRGLAQPDRDALARKINGVRWVDPNLVAGLKREVDYGGKFLRGMEAVNAPFRFSVLYLKPAYAINLLQNIGTAAVRQGVFTPKNMVDSLRLQSRLPTGDVQKIFSLVGEGGARTFTAETGFSKGTMEAGAEFWNKIVDKYPRAAAWLHEARTMGYNTPEKINVLLNDGRFAQDVSEISRRANKEAVEYGNMTPFERNVLKRMIFFYGWTRGSTLYALRFPFEHPVTTAAIASGVGGNLEAIEKERGPLPSYLEGSFTIGKNRLVDPANVNTFLTPAEVYQGAKGLFEPSGWPRAGAFAQQLSPAMGGLYTLASGKTTLGYDLPGVQSRVEGALSQLTSALPEATLFKRLGQPPEEAGARPEERRIYQTGGFNPWGKFLGGGAFAATEDREAREAKARKEERTMMSPTERSLSSHMEFRNELLGSARESGVIGPKQVQPKAVSSAITERSKRYTNYARNGLKRGDAGYQRKALQLDQELLVREGKITKQQADERAAWAESASDEEIERFRRQVGDYFFGSKTISEARSAINFSYAQTAFKDLTTRLVREKTISAEQAKRGLDWLQGVQTRKDIIEAIHAITQRYKLDPVEVPQAPQAP